MKSPNALGSYADILVIPRRHKSLTTDLWELNLFGDERPQTTDR